MSAVAADVFGSVVALGFVAIDCVTAVPWFAGCDRLAASCTADVATGHLLCPSLTQRLVVCAVSAPGCGSTVGAMSHAEQF